MGEEDLSPFGDNDSLTLKTSFKNDGCNRLSKARYLDKPSHKLIRIIITIIMYCSWSLAFTLSCCVQVLLWVFLFPLFLSNPYIKTLVMGSIFHFFSSASGFFVNPFWRLVVVKPPPKNYKPRDTLIMVNHTSGADPWIVSSALFPWELKYIFKSDLLKVPIAGWTLAMSGDIPVHFTGEKGGWGTAQGSVQKMMEACKALQDMGIGQVIFPEGTRSRSGRLQPFKDGFFRFAIENQCEILPCMVHNAQKIWPMGSWLLDMGTVYFVFGEPTRPLEGETLEELKRRIRNEMIALQRLCPLYDPEAEKPYGEDEIILTRRGQGIRGRKMMN